MDTSQRQEFLLNKKDPPLGGWVEGGRVECREQTPSPVSIPPSFVPLSALTAAASQTHFSPVSNLQWGLFGTLVYISLCIKLTIQIIVTQIFILHETFNEAKETFSLSLCICPGLPTSHL